jgi:2-amino-1-hydroxyethylphosphonate dioxygenase (glycine-forming)
MTTEQKTANEIVQFFEQFGNRDYIGEPVSQIEHMCQCAALAEAASAEEEVILAAWLHDIGHLCAYAFPEWEAKYMDEVGVVDHEMLGANYLRNKGFAEKVCRLVENHVAAKRYLTYFFPNYYDQLSDASKKTLAIQGGVMNKEEAKTFEMDALFNDYLLLRRWDDQAKKRNQTIPSLTHYKQMIIDHLTKQNVKQNAH